MGVECKTLEVLYVIRCCVGSRTPLLLHWLYAAYLVHWEIFFKSHQSWRIQILKFVGTQSSSEIRGLPDLKKITFLDLQGLSSIRHCSFHVKAPATQAIHVVAIAGADRTAGTGECPLRLSFFSISINISI